METIQIGENSYEIKDLTPEVQGLISRANELSQEEASLAMRVNEVKALVAIYSSSIIEAVEPKEETTNP